MPNSAKCMAGKVVATIRKKAREEVDCPSHIHGCSLYATLNLKKKLTFGVEILGVGILRVDILES